MHERNSEGDRATKSSTLLPNYLKDATGRPDRSLTLHFANQLWRFNTAEIMGASDTDPSVFSAVVDFARQIGMAPIELRKEKAGHVPNSLLVPFRIYDIIGLTTPYDIMTQSDTEQQKLAAWLKGNYIGKGKLGIASGEGFYKYS